MRPHLKLFPRFLVNVRRSLHGKLFDLGRQRDRTDDLGPAPPHRLDNFRHRLIEHSVVKPAQADPDSLIDLHAQLPILSAK